MNRRKFLALSGVSVAGLALGGAGLAGASLGESRDFDLTALLAQLKNLQGKPLQSSGEWTAAQIFRHCAQSIQGSLTGFPQQKSPVFQQTAGKLALFSFKAAGAMTHPLAEPIPGMAALDKNEDAQQALTLLITELELFIAQSQAGKALQPHFAYGALSATDYQAAHWLHLQNHLSQISVNSAAVA
jgi:hypothetical protein